MLVSNAEIEKAIKEVAKRDGEIIKLNQDINTLLDQLDDLDEDLIVKEDTSKKYKGLVDCYRAALFSWYDMNGKKGLTERDHLVINIQLRTSLFNCPPI